MVALYFALLGKVRYEFLHPHMSFRPAIMRPLRRARALIITLAIWIVAFALPLPIAHLMESWSGFSKAYSIHGVQLGVSLLACFVGLYLTHGLSPRQSFRELGLNGSVLEGLVVGVLAFAPVLLLLAVGAKLWLRLWVAIGPGIVSPFAEELLFRGYLFRQLYRRAGLSLKRAMALSVTLFALSHLPERERWVILAAVAGLVLSVAFVLWRENLWVASALHACVNLALNGLQFRSFPAFSLRWSVIAAHALVWSAVAAGWAIVLGLGSWRRRVRSRRDGAAWNPPVVAATEGDNKGRPGVNSGPWWRSLANSVLAGGALALLLGIASVMLQKSAWAFHDEQAQKFVESSAEAVMQTWDCKALRARMTPEASTQVSETSCVEPLPETLGALAKLHSVMGERALVLKRNWCGLGAVYRVHADFKRGSGTIELQLLRVGNQWRIDSLSGSTD